MRPKLRDTDTATSAWEKDNKEIILPVWQGRLQFLAEILEGLRADILAFGENFANIEDSDLESLKTPVIMTNAWVHITLALTTFPSDYGRSLELAKRAAHQIHAGMKEIIAARSDSLGIQDLVVLPSDLVALMSLKLTSNAGPNKLDIFSIYGSYLNIIVGSTGNFPCSSPFADISLGLRHCHEATRPQNRPRAKLIRPGAIDYRLDTGASNTNYQSVPSDKGTPFQCL